MSYALAITVFVWLVGIIGVVVWDQRGPIGWFKRKLFGDNSEKWPVVIGCYVCMSWWIALPVGVAVSIIAQDWGGMMGAGAAIAWFFVRLPDVMLHRGDCGCGRDRQQAESTGFEKQPAAATSSHKKG